MSDSTNHEAPSRPDRALPSVSVVIPTFRRRAGLAAVLHPLLADPATLEVVVVVDGSDDGSIELLEGLAKHHPELRPVLTRNQGGAAARQHGIDLADGDVVLLVDDDVVAGPDLVTGHARLHAEADDLVVLGYMPTRLPDGRQSGRFATRLYADEYEGACRLYENDPEQVLLRLWGGNVSLRRDQLARVPYDSGPFSRTNHSDRDFGIRCLKAGLRGRFDRSLLASHEHDRPLDAFLRDAQKQGAGKYGVHLQHADVLEPFSLPDTIADLPRPLRDLLALDRWQPVAMVLYAVLGGCARGAGALGVTQVEVPAAKLSRRLAIRRGVRQAMSVPPPGA